VLEEAQDEARITAEELAHSCVKVFKLKVKLENSKCINNILERQLSADITLSKMVEEHSSAQNVPVAECMQDDGMTVNNNQTSPLGLLVSQPVD
jgi:hypothetical protein